MENEVFERDYTTYKEADGGYSDEIFDQIMTGGFFKAYTEAMNQVPKVIVQKDKENYEYLLPLCDDIAKRHGGKIRAVVDYEKWLSYIELHLKFLAFEDTDEMNVLKEIAERAHSVTIESETDGVFMRIMICYFEELMNDVQMEYIKYDSIMKDERLAEMLGLDDVLSPEMEETALRIRTALDRFEKETPYSRTAIFKTVLASVSQEPEENQTLEFMAELMEQALTMMTEGNMDQIDAE